ncbi:DUF4468 domain-containing protein [Empedobacter falsenii]|uniref:DUF4468 domain-containing protein n=1 Tax=Empedobacter falsenii TaxID=343874 RepID=UPI002574A139|nr:DUF4468 domain-containing protein [Empedobacter falsenii]MDM1061930.1 DUF4468 domain-containing protein [Empedobacter falsenii]
MKYIILFFMLFAVNMQAQKFRLKPSGFVNSDDNSKNYVVLEFPNQSQSDLFKKAMIYATKNYKSANNVVSKVDNEAITINAISSIPIRRNALHVFQNQYTIILSFKDGKIKVDAPIVNMTRFIDGEKKTLHVSWNRPVPLNESNVGVYGKDDKLKSEKALEDLERFANEFLEKLKNGIESESSANDDW